MHFKWKKRLKGVRVQSLKRDIVHETDNLVKDLKILSKDKATNRATTINEYLLLMTRMNRLIAESLSQIQNKSKETVYLVPSLFLHESFEFLNQREVESLHFVTGPEVGGIKVFDKIVDLNLEQQNIVFAKADPISINRVLIHLDDYKFKLQGHIHIHPGKGANSNFPSGIDLNLDRLLNRGNYEAIGAIFSRDGFVRFFSSKQFKIQIYGEGVEQIDEKLFYLVKVS